MAERPTRFSALRTLLTGEDGHDQEGQNQDEQENGDEGETGPEDDEDNCEAGGAEDESQGDEGGEAGGDEAANQGDAEAANQSAAAATKAERVRWASVLTHESAQGRFEAATSMLVEDMSADAIIRVLAKLPKENAAAARLASTPRHNLGTAPQGEGGNDNAASASRRKAVNERNAGIGKGVKTTTAKQRLAAGASNRGE